MAKILLISFFMVMIVLTEGLILKNKTILTINEKINPEKPCKCTYYQVCDGIIDPT